MFGDLAASRVQKRSPRYWFARPPQERAPSLTAPQFRRNKTSKTPLATATEQRVQGVEGASDQAVRRLCRRDVMKLIAAVVAALVIAAPAQAHSVRTPLPCPDRIEDRRDRRESARDAAYDRSFRDVREDRRDRRESRRDERVDVCPVAVIRH